MHISQWRCWIGCWTPKIKAHLSIGLVLEGVVYLFQSHDVVGLPVSCSPNYSVCLQAHDGKLNRKHKFLGRKLEGPTINKRRTPLPSLLETSYRLRIPRSISSLRSLLFDMSLWHARQTGLCPWNLYYTAQLICLFRALDIISLFQEAM